MTSVSDSRTGNAPDFTPAFLTHMRELTPLVQCITNTVVQEVAANILLASGASPAMVDHEADAAAFAKVANGVSVNFGTPSSHTYLSIDAAVQQRTEDGTTWVLDPVGLGVAPFRTARVVRALSERPTVVRGNASEVAGLAGMGQGARGIEAVDDVESALPAASKISNEYGSVVAISGPTDAIVTAIDGTTYVSHVEGGSTYMPLVVGTGCSLGALVAGYAGTAHHLLNESATTEEKLTRYHQATVTAHAHFAAAGLRAHELADGPGSFKVHFLDQLHAVTETDLHAINVTTEEL